MINSPIHLHAMQTFSETLKCSVLHLGVNGNPINMLTSYPNDIGRETKNKNIFASFL